uniref:Receptor expression-enhancing protein n=1 Tax=Globodera pallida TaxID=36090 RepID=A0A183BPE6_GLOPA
MSDESASSGGGGVRLQPRQVPVNSFNDVRPVLQQTLRQMEQPFIRKLEEMSGMDREKHFYIACAVVTLFLMFGPGNAILCTLIGVAYPGYQSVLAVRTQTKTDDTQWLIYWCSFAMFTQLDYFFAPFGRVVPVYMVLKTIFLLYLALPQTYGAHNVYVKFGQPLATWVEMQTSKSKTK